MISTLIPQIVGWHSLYVLGVLQKHTISGCGAVGSVPALGAGGPRFESWYPDIYICGEIGKHAAFKLQSLWLRVRISPDVLDI